MPTSSCRCRQGSFRSLHQIWSFKFPQTLAPVPFPGGVFSPRCDSGNAVPTVKILASVSTRANSPPPSLSADARTQLNESPSLLFQGLLRSSPELQESSYPLYHSLNPCFKNLQALCRQPNGHRPDPQRANS